MRRAVGVVVAGLAAVVGLTACAPARPPITPEVATTASPAPSPTVTPSATDAPLRDLARAAGIEFGTALNVDLLTNPAYASLAGSQFGSVTPENAMKWASIEPTRGTYRWGPADAVVAFAQAHGQQIRGHTLIWHNQTPSWLAGVAATLTDAQFADLVKQHIVDEMTHFRGRITGWDVVNEAFDDSGRLRDTIFSSRLGPDYLATVFGWAHEADPDALLFYNDYGLEYSGAKSQAVLAMARDLRARGIPLDGIGLQAHYETSAPVPGSLAGVLKGFTDLGLKVAITEMDVRGAGTGGTITAAPDTITPYYTTTLDACLALDGCLSFTVWGISDKDSWVPSSFPGQAAACLYDAAYQPNPWFTDVVAALKRGA